LIIGITVGLLSVAYQNQENMEEMRKG